MQIKSCCCCKNGWKKRICSVRFLLFNCDFAHFQKTMTYLQEDNIIFSRHSEEKCVLAINCIQLLVTLSKASVILRDSHGSPLRHWLIFRSSRCSLQAKRKKPFEAPSEMREATAEKWRFLRFLVCPSFLPFIRHIRLSGASTMRITGRGTRASREYLLFFARSLLPQLCFEPNKTVFGV